jgi:hypothetical protein
MGHPSAKITFCLLMEIDLKLFSASKEEGMFFRGRAPKFNRTHFRLHGRIQRMQSKFFMKGCNDQGIQGGKQPGLYLSHNGRLGKDDDATIR